MWKKLVSLVLALTVVALLPLLSGCGPTGSSEVDTEVKTRDGDVTEARETRTTTIDR